MAIGRGLWNNTTGSDNRKCNERVSERNAEERSIEKIEEVFDPKVIRLIGDDDAPMPVQSIVDGAKFAAFIDEAVADAVKRMESDTSDIGQSVLEALRDSDGKVVVETMSPEFMSFIGDAYRSLRWGKD